MIVHRSNYKIQTVPWRAMSYSRNDYIKSNCVYILLFIFPERVEDYSLGLERNKEESLATSFWCRARLARLIARRQTEKTARRSPIKGGADGPFQIRRNIGVLAIVTVNATIGTKRRTKRIDESVDRF